MVKKVLIVGAGSIGNHLAFSCRRNGWHVTLFDIDKNALSRTKQDIYPSRYGTWDEEISLVENTSAQDDYDLIIVGTPPDTHNDISISILKEHQPGVLLVEKPLSTPDLKGCEKLWELSQQVRTKVLVGYNHNLTANTQRAEEILNTGFIGEPLSIHVRWLEHWGGIFQAHPWLSGPSDSYLGSSSRGGGACGEHSHAISLWQHFARIMGCGRIKVVTASMDFWEQNSHYDRTAQLFLETDNGLIGSVIQDVITEPAQKMMRIQGTDGFLEWYANFDNGHDAIISGKDTGKQKLEKFSKTRADDFHTEIIHVGDLLEDRELPSPISLEYGLDTMMVIAAAHVSNRDKRTVSIEDNRYQLAALVPYNQTP